MLFSPFCSVCKRSWKLQKSRSAPTEVCVSHIKYCSWNTSPVIPPSILWLCDITLCHHVTHLHHLCLKTGLAPYNWFSAAALSLLAVMGQACVSWPIRADWEFGKGGFKETGAKTQLFKQRGDTVPQQWTVWENWCVFWALKQPILVVTQNEIVNLSWATL